VPILNYTIQEGAFAYFYQGSVKVTVQISGSFTLDVDSNTQSNVALTFKPDAPNPLVYDGDYLLPAPRPADRDTISALSQDGGTLEGVIDFITRRPKPGMSMNHVIFRKLDTKEEIVANAQGWAYPPGEEQDG
jgi:hypothetical protein